MSTSEKSNKVINSRPNYTICKGAKLLDHLVPFCAGCRSWRQYMVGYTFDIDFVFFAFARKTCHMKSLEPTGFRCGQPCESVLQETIFYFSYYVSSLFCHYRASPIIDND